MSAQPQQQRPCLPLPRPRPCIHSHGKEHCPRSGCPAHAWCPAMYACSVCRVSSALRSPTSSALQRGVTLGRQRALSDRAPGPPWAHGQHACIGGRMACARAAYHGNCVKADLVHAFALHACGGVAALGNGAPFAGIGWSAIPGWKRMQSRGGAGHILPLRQGEDAVCPFRGLVRPGRVSRSSSAAYTEQPALYAAGRTRLAILGT